MEEKYNPLSDCAFYKGEDTCPESTLQIDVLAGLFWAGEKLYTEVVEDYDSIREIEEFYKNCGLEGIDYTISHLLKACIFFELCRQSDIDPFDDAMHFYKNVLPRYLALLQHR